MVSTVKIPRAYSEVYSFINTLGIEYIEKIPNKVYNTIRDNRDKEYNPIYKKEQTLKEGVLSYEALCLLSALNLQYWCNDNEEKSLLKQKYIENTKKEQEKYSYDNLFKKNNDSNIDNNLMVVKKENVFKKIINIIKNFFKK